MANRLQFNELFERYRLKSELGTYAKFGQALAEEGFVYEDSIFSKWKSGERMPTDRRLLLAMLKIFIRRKSIESIEDANAFLYSVDQRNLDDEEQELMTDSLASVAEPYSEYKPLVEPSYLYHDIPVNEDTTRLIMLNDVNPAFRDYWQYQSLCAVSAYFSHSCPTRSITPPETFKILRGDIYDNAGMTTTIVAITTDPYTGQEYLSVTDRISTGNKELDPPLNGMRYVGAKGNWLHEKDGLQVHQVGELDRYVVPNWAWPGKVYMTRKGFQTISDYARKRDIRYFYALVSQMMIDICTEGVLPIENIPDTYAYEPVLEREYMYLSTYNSPLEFFTYWQKKYFLYKFSLMD